MADNRQIGIFIGATAAVGAFLGLASTPDGREALLGAGKTVRAAADTRERPPQSGDYWSGCDAARAAGTAPIYYGEPGYREGMDGDGDGIACEPYFRR